MKKLLAVLGVVALSLGAVSTAPADMALMVTIDEVVPTVIADTTGLFFETVVDEIVAWDPEFLEIASASSPGPGDDFAVGSQKVTQVSGDFQHVRVSAHSGPAGEDPKGSVRITFQSSAVGFGAGVPAADVKGDVECLSVTGNVARVVALLREPLNGRTHATLVIFDNGNPGPLMGQSPDMAFIGFSAAPSLSCLTFTFGFTLLGDASGNLVVKDAL